MIIDDVDIFRDHEPRTTKHAALPNVDGWLVDPSSGGGDGVDSTLNVVRFLATGGHYWPLNMDRCRANLFQIALCGQMPCC